MAATRRKSRTKKAAKPASTTTPTARRKTARAGVFTTLGQSLKKFATGLVTKKRKKRKPAKKAAAKKAPKARARKTPAT